MTFPARHCLAEHGGPVTKVLFVAPSLHVGGEERAVFDLVMRLDRSRFAPTVVCCYGAGEIGDRLQQEGVPVYHDLFRNRSDLRGARRLLELCRKERFDLLHVNEQPLAMLWGRAAGSLSGIRASVMSIHTTGPVGRRRRRWLNRAFPFNAIVALSHDHRRELEEVEHLPANRLHVIHNGIDPAPYLEAFGAAWWPDAVPRGVPLVGIVAMLRPEKAHAVFLRAAAAVSTCSPAHFIIVGDGPERVRLMKLAADLGLAQRVHFLGRRFDVPQIMAALDIAVLSSSTEALPIAILEAMACARPVVCTKVGLIHEVVNDHETGILVPAGEPAQLAQGILYLLGNPDTARRMGEVGRRRLLEHFTIERMVARTEQLYEQLLEGLA